jgi:hypothetical protein
MARIAQTVITWLARQSMRLTIATHIKRAKASGEWSEKFEQFLRSEMQAYYHHCLSRASHYDSEVDIVSDRLSRRYDPGMALNEATERALAKKREDSTTKEIQPLTHAQMKALEFQKAYLKNIVRNS